jgi:hypothetical protein
MHKITPPDFTTTLWVDKTPEEISQAIDNVSGWWTTNVKGNSEKSNDVFTVHFGETFITLQIVAHLPGKKIVWEVIDCYKHWLKDKKEWKGTKINWEISIEKNVTQIHFTHIGLVPGIECYNGCEKAWNFYINESFLKLLNEGKGQPVK